MDIVGICNTQPLQQVIGTGSGCSNREITGIAGVLCTDIESLLGGIEVCIQSGFLQFGQYIRDRGIFGNIQFYACITVLDLKSCIVSGGNAGHGAAITALDPQIRQFCQCIQLGIRSDIILQGQLAAGHIGGLGQL